MPFCLSNPSICSLNHIFPFLWEPYLSQVFFLSAVLLTSLFLPTCPLFISFQWSLLKRLSSSSSSSSDHFTFGASTGKESACNAGDLGSIPGLGRSPGEKKGYPLQYSGLENSADCIVHGVAKSWTWLTDFHFSSESQVSPKSDIYLPPLSHFLTV